tara:strand:+ start:4467 stop:5579 length:1113 start_codon:yes stop_codon:yes gene_type:complete
MRILFIASAASAHSQKWITYFANRGHHILWFSLHGEDNLFVPHPNINLVANTAGFSGLLGAFDKLWRMIRDFSPDVTHVHSVGSYGLAGAVLGRRPIVMSPWGSDINRNKKHLIKRGILHLILRRADLVTADANYILEASRRLGREDTRYERINFGVDTKSFSPEAASRSAFELAKLTGCETFEVENFNIVSTRNFHSVYDVACLIRAMPQIMSALPKTRLYLCGKGPEESNLRQLCADLGLSHAVSFVGHLDQTIMPAFLAGMDVFVSTSKSDAGIAASTAEAMACGVPVVITDIYENGDWVDEGRAGLLFPEGDSSALAAAVNRLAEMDEHRLRQMVKSARKKICEQNCLNTQMQRMEELLFQLVVQR